MICTINERKTTHLDRNPMKKQCNFLVIMAVALSVLTGCMWGIPEPTLSLLTKQELLDGKALLGQSLDPNTLPDENILDLSPEMNAVVDDRLPVSKNQSWRLEHLLRYLFSEDGIGLKYDHTQTLTASGAFQKGSVNCLSYANLMVAYARALGLEANFQQIDIPATWENPSADTFLYDNHVNVVIDLGSGALKVTDINAPRGLVELQKFRSFIIPDKRAFAQYYNNIGVNHLIEDNKREAFRYFRKAILTDSGYASLWVNLGTLYRRYGYNHHAESAYYAALRINKGEYLALSNLQTLYASIGEAEKARIFNYRVESQRRKNPYYQLYLARQLVKVKDYRQAEKHLQKALDVYEDEISFHFLLGWVQMKLNKPDRARIHLDRAEELAHARLEYNHKLKMIRAYVAS